MKKLLSILFSLIIILSGLNFSIAAHYCGGDLIAWKVSVDHDKASCGMCADEMSTSGSINAESCCKDSISVLNVDNNYQPSQFKLPVSAPFITQTFVVPQHTGLLQPNAAITLYASIHPPENYSGTEVNLSDICVFRI